MSEYTPTTELVKAIYINEIDREIGECNAEFDSWLTSVKANAYRMGYNRATSDIIEGKHLLKAKADAWDEGHEAGFNDSSAVAGEYNSPNPYRGEQA